MITFQEKIGYQFQNGSLLEQAFTHKSFHNEQGHDSRGHNERLEFLGDAVLDLALADYLMKTYPQSSEGELSKVRASLVNEAILAEVARAFEMNRLIRLGKGEVLTNGSEKPRLLASVFEAFIGAFYIDAGYGKVLPFIVDVFEEYVSDMDPKQGFSTDFKTRLQEMTQEKFKRTPGYRVVSELGPDHEKTFVVEVEVNEEFFYEARGRSKKQAEQAAAQKALKEIFND